MKAGAKSIPLRQKHSDNAAREPAVTLKEWCAQNFVLFDDQHGIAPWGFNDSVKEASFRKHFTVTFVDNHQRFLAFLFSTVSFIHVCTLLQMSWSPPSWMLAITLFRCVGTAFTAFGFGQKHTLLAAKKFFRITVLSNMFWVFSAVTAFQVYGLKRALLIKVIVAGYSFFVGILKCDFAIATISVLVFLFGPVIRACVSSSSQLSAPQIIDLFVFNAFSCTLCLLFNASLQVFRRRQWLRSSSSCLRSSYSSSSSSSRSSYSSSSSSSPSSSRVSSVKSPLKKRRGSWSLSSLSSSSHHGHRRRHQHSLAPCPRCHFTLGELSESDYEEEEEEEEAEEDLKIAGGGAEVEGTLCGCGAAREDGGGGGERRQRGARAEGGEARGEARAGAEGARGRESREPEGGGEGKGGGKGRAEGAALSVQKEEEEEERDEEEDQRAEGVGEAQGCELDRVEMVSWPGGWVTSEGQAGRHQ